MSELKLLSDPEIVGMPVHECGEPLVDLRNVVAIRLDSRLADPEGAYAHLRLGVVDRLVTAQTLLPAGLRLLVVEGYRPLGLQTLHFNDHVERLRKRKPDRDYAWLHQQASQYISPPEVAPHTAGAAVDLTLCTMDGAELWMGTEVNDTDGGLCFMAAADIDAEARQNRRTLAGALEAVGLVNYHTEWWHWSYGDRIWAWHTQAGAARYGPMTQ